MSRFPKWSLYISLSERNFVIQLQICNSLHSKATVALIPKTSLITKGSFSGESKNFLSLFVCFLLFVVFKINVKETALFE